jgi:XTP/dITP diphosphohydrolase
VEYCFATNNQHKIQEVKELVGSSISILSLQDIGCHEELKEEQPTIEGNSLQKARYVFSQYHIPCFADDSGLEVVALNGEPGVHSAYYSGSRDFNSNIALVLKKLQGRSNRTAHFKTVITLVAPAIQKQFEGILKGQILVEKRGEQGFGYDPIFLPDGYQKTLAEISLTEKNKISHRAQAVDKLIMFLKGNFS